MTDTNQTPAKEKRPTVADRQWIDPTGTETSDETKASGFRYVQLGTGKDKAERIASGDSFEYQFAPCTCEKCGHSNSLVGTPVMMCGVFGALTKAGNVVNTWNHLEAADRAPKAIQAVSDWFGILDSGTWGEERTGGVGIRFDRDALATACSQATGRNRDEFVAKLADGAPKVRVRREGPKVIADPNGKQEVLYGTYVLYNAKIKEIYNGLVGATGPSLDEI